MSLARWQATIVDEAGNIQAGATVEVRNEATGNLASLKSDRAGLTGILNPMTADAEGFAGFHVVGGAYRITATLGGFTREWRYVAIGTAGEIDTGALSGFAGLSYAFATETASDAAAGTVRANQANLADATELYFSITDQNGNDNSDFLLTVGDSSATIKGYVTVQALSGGAHVIYEITGVSVDLRPTDDVIAVPVSHVSGGSVSYAAGDDLAATFVRHGSDGADGADGADGTLSAKIPLTANATFYVRTDGSDAAGVTGLVNAAAASAPNCAFLTWQACWNYIRDNYYFNGFSVTMQAGGSGAGRTFSNGAGGILSVGGWGGGGNLSILGDTTTPANVTLSSTGGDTIKFSGVLPGNVTVAGFTLTSTTSGYLLNTAATGGEILFGTPGAERNVLGVCAGSAMIAATWKGASMHTERFTVSGDAQRVIDADAGIIQMNTGSYSVTGTRTFGAFARVRQHGTLICLNSWNVTGTVTGSRYEIKENGYCQVDANDASFFPGSTPGTITSGGIYTGTIVQDGGARNANYLLNGSFSIAQRGTSFTSGTSPANSDDLYLFDQWILLSDGNNVVDVTRDTSTFPTGGVHSCKMQVITVNKKFGLFQVLEQFNTVGLVGQQVTLSFFSKVSNTARLDKIKAAIVSWTGTADIVTSDIVSAWGADGTTPTLVANWTLENTPVDLGVTTSWARYEITANIDTASAKNVGVFIWSDNVTDTDVADELWIAHVKLERGGQATEFEYVDMTTEQARCQRYVYQLNATDGTTSTRRVINVMHAFNTTSAWGALLDLPVEMRTTPTVSVSSMSHFTIWGDAGGSASSTISSGTFEENSKRNLATFNGVVAGSAIFIDGQASQIAITNAAGWLRASAEL